MDVFAQYGLGGLAVGAVVAVVKLFTSYASNRDEQFTTFLGNHMSKHTAALEDLAVVIKEMRAEARAR